MKPVNGRVVQLNNFRGERNPPAEVTPPPQLPASRDEYIAALKRLFARSLPLEADTMTMFLTSLLETAQLTGTDGDPLLARISRFRQEHADLLTSFVKESAAMAGEIGRKAIKR